jgi:F420-dependent oxidoreductase-like protein
VRLSISITDVSFPGGPSGLAASLDTLVRAADEGGLDTVWVSDHLIQAAPGSEPGSAMLEAYTTLGYLAGRCRRVRLGAMVTAATYRPAALLIKAVTTLDVLSGGRAWLGIGAGYHEQEARALGLPLPPTAERFERLEETLQLARQMWAGDVTPFAGRHLRLEDPHVEPRPLSRPHPPILVGGTGERQTLRLVARYADACNLFDIPDGSSTVRRKLEVLARHCEAVGRPPEQVEHTISTRLELGESAGSFAERCGRLAALGIDHAVVIHAGPWTEEAIATLAAAVPAVDGLSARRSRDAAAGRSCGTRAAARSATRAGS